VRPYFAFLYGTYYGIVVTDIILLSLFLLVLMLCIAYLLSKDENPHKGKNPDNASSYEIQVNVYLLYKNSFNSFLNSKETREVRDQSDLNLTQVNWKKMIEKILAENRVPNIEELCIVFGQVDKGGQASRIAKTTIVSTLGYGEIGERYPISLKNTRAWCELALRYSRSKNELGQDHEYTNTVGMILWSSTLDLIARSFTKENSSILLDYLLEVWKMKR